jgi:hypothetical protein
MSVVSPLTAGDAFGFAALILIGLAAILMLLRSKLLKLTKNLFMIRVTHIAISTLAGSFLVLHIAILFSPPASTGIILGYASLIVSVIVWITGTAFLKKLRDSLFFHGTLATILIALTIVHAAIASPNIPFFFSQIMLGATVVLMTANASVQLWRAFSRA